MKRAGLGREAELYNRRIDAVRELGQRMGRVVDAGPHDARLVERRERAEPRRPELEWRNAGDRDADLVAYRGDRIAGRPAEELQRHVIARRRDPADVELRVLRAPPEGL